MSKNKNKESVHQNFAVQYITKDFVFGALVATVTRLFLDWPIVILISIVVGLAVSFYRSKQKFKYFDSSRLLIYVLSASIILVIFEFLTINAV